MTSITLANARPSVAFVLSGPFIFYSSPCQRRVLLRFLLSSAHFSLPVLNKTEHEESEQLSEVGEIQKCRRENPVNCRR